MSEEKKEHNRHTKTVWKMVSVADSKVFVCAVCKETSSYGICTRPQLLLNSDCTRYSCEKHLPEVIALVDAIEKPLSEIDSLRAQVERLGYLELASKDDYTAVLIDRLNSLVRENRKYFEECDSGPTAADLVVLIHSAFNQIKFENSDLKHRLKACEKSLKGALEYMRHAPICSIRNARKCDCGLPEVEEAALKALEGKG